VTDVQDAIELWWKGDEYLKEFVDTVAFLPESDTSTIAEGCQCSISTIQNHRKAGVLHYRMMQYFEDPEIYELWHGLTLSHWKALVRYDLKPEKMLEHLRHAKEAGLSSHAFRAHLNSVERDTPEWMGSVKNMYRSALKFKDSYMSEIPPEKQKKARILVKVIERLIKELTS